MLSLLIALISIALVAALAVVTLYYGGSLLNRAIADANASRLLSQGHQLIAAADLHLANTGQYPELLSELVDKGYLKALPTARPSFVPPAHALAASWTMAPREPLFSLEASVDKSTCASFNSKASLGVHGVLKNAYVELAQQCFGEAETYTVLMKKSGDITLSGINLRPEQVASVPLGAALPDADAWDLEPTGDLPPAEEEPASGPFSVTHHLRAPGTSYSARASVSGDSTSGFTASLLDSGSTFLLVRNISPEPLELSVLGARETADGVVSYLYTLDDYSNPSAATIASFALNSGAESCRVSTLLEAGQACSVLANLPQGFSGTYPVARINSVPLNMAFTPDWEPMYASKLWGFNGVVYALSGGGSYGTGALRTTQQEASIVPAPKVFLETGQQFVDITASTDSAVYVRNDGQVWGRGTNVYGELAQGNTQAVPVEKYLGMDHAVRVFGDSFSTQVIRSDGSLWGAGYGTGQRRTQSNTMWYQRTELPEPVVDGSTWGNGVFAWSARGNLYFWGTLNGTSYTMATPYMTGVVKVASAHGNALILKTDGSVLSAGTNAHGQLGIGHKSAQAPLEWNTVFVGARDVAVSHNLAYPQSFIVGLDGRLHAAGSPGAGISSGNALGLGPLREALSFTLVPGVSQVAQVSATGTATLLLRGDGTVWRAGNGGMFLRSHQLHTTEFVPVNF